MAKTDIRLIHPKLKPGSNALTVFNIIHANPGITSRELRNSFGIHHQRVSDLLYEGLIRVTGTDANGWRCYEVVQQMKTGKRRQAVHIAVMITADEKGHMIITARSKDGIILLPKEFGNAIKHVTFMLPRADEFNMVDAQTGGLTIEGAATILSEK